MLNSFPARPWISVVSRAMLMKRECGHQADMLSRTVDTHISELRWKLESVPRASIHILTARKPGYRLRREGTKPA